MRNLIKTTLLVTPLLLAACGKDSPVEPPPQPPPTNPTYGTGQITASGGTVSLEDGTAVVFPDGAVSTTVTVTVAKKTPATWFDGTGATERRVISSTASVTSFLKPVEIRVPLTQGMTADDAENVSAGLLDESTGAITAEPFSIRMIDGKPFAVIETDHFSSRVVEWLFGAKPPASAGPLAIPYYSQGQSDYCWAASLQMVTQAVNFEQERSIVDIIGKTGVDESGITSASFRFGSGIAELVRARTGVRPLRQTWDRINRDQMRDYILREIGVNKRPVALFVGQWNHAVVVVGYQNRNSFLVHDPASTSDNAAGYTVKTWSEIIDPMTVLHNMVTLTIPADIHAGDGVVRINLLERALRVVKPATPDAPSAVYDFRWDHERSNGYSFRHLTSGNRAEPFPGDVSAISSSSGIQLSNSSRTRAEEVSVWVDITATGAPVGTGHYSTQQTVSLPPNSLRYVTVAPIPVDTFRFNQEGSTEYLLSVTALVDGTVVDRQSVVFRIGVLTPEIASLSPASGPVGTTVAILGKNFGPSQHGNSVKFNRIKVTEIVSWSDSLIEVKVPESASTGPVAVSRGYVVSNEVEFTVTTTSTVGDAFEYSSTGQIMSGVTITVDGTWSLTGQNPFQSDPGDLTGLGTDIGVPATFGLSYDGTISPTEIIKYAADSSRTEWHLKPMECEQSVVARGNTFSYTESGSSGSGSVNFTFDHFNQSITVTIFCRYYADIFDFDKHGLLKSETRHSYINGRTVAIFYIRPY